MARLTTIIVLAALAGCATNPVTGTREFAFVSESQEIAIGEEQYGFGRQAYGGELVALPELDAYVRGVGERLAAVSDRPLPYEFTVINDSTPNAWALPGGKIAINRGLLTEMDSEAELAAVLGHEIVHAAARHGAKAMERQVLIQGAALATMVVASDSQYGNLVMAGTGVLGMLLNQKYGRDAERESDQYGTIYLSRAGYDPAAAVALQETFVRLSEGRETSWLEGLFASHPPSVERVENNRAVVATLPSGGETGKVRYDEALARLRAVEPAYTSYDLGRKALAEGATDRALSHAEKALEIFPDEANFHALRGDIRASSQQWKSAITNYDRAVARYDSYFYPLMRRGLAHKATRDATKATADLEKSMALLPSAEASNALGELRLQAGQEDEAIEYFRMAASAPSPAGKSAKRSLTRLELPRAPHRYLRADVGLMNDGMLGVRISNPTELPVRGLRVAIQYLTDDGQVVETLLNARGWLQPGDSMVVATRYGPYTDPGVVRRFRAGVARAVLED